jgi:hypothetical protein
VDSSSCSKVSERWDNPVNEMTLDEYMEELKQVPGKLVGTLLEKLLETEEVQQAKAVYENGCRLTRKFTK